MRAFAAAQGWTLVAEFSDVASGKDDRRPGFQAALARCRQLGAVLAAARLDRITRRAHTLSQLLEDGYSIRAADMPGRRRPDDAGLRRHGAEGARADQRAHRAALAAAKARGQVWAGTGATGPRRGRTRRLRPWRAGWPRPGRAPAGAGGRAAARRGRGRTGGMARALTERGVPTPWGGAA